MSTLSPSQQLGAAIRNADQYTTARQRHKSLAPGLGFYTRVGLHVFHAWLRKRLGQSEDRVMEPGLRIATSAEKVGSRLEISGLDHIRNLPGPAVIVGNHMSTYETLILPAIAGTRHPISFVLKGSLLRYPIFGPVVQTGEPIVVSRENPREDLATVLSEGVKRLEAGRHVIVFPQGHRVHGFDAESFNSLGVKLAKRAKVPVVPLALRTDFWGNGSVVKDIGPVTPQFPVQIAFGQPLTVSGNGKQQHDACVAFIQQQLRAWEFPLDQPQRNAPQEPETGVGRHA